jgi:hypothetical protein
MNIQERKVFEEFTLYKEENEPKINSRIKRAFAKSVSKLKNILPKTETPLMAKLDKLIKQVETSQSSKKLSDIQKTLKRIELKIKDNKAKAVILGLITLLSSAIVLKQITKTHHIQKKK